MRYAIALLLVAFIGLGCATTGQGGLTKAQAADLVISQLQATLESAEAVAAVLSEEGVAPEEMQIARVILAAAKPQIISWINLIETLQLNASQEVTTDALLERAAAIDPQILLDAGVAPDTP